MGINEILLVLKLKKEIDYLTKLQNRPEISKFLQLRKSKTNFELPMIALMNHEVNYEKT